MAQNPIRVVSEKGINVRATLANCPDNNMLMLIWYQQIDAVDPFNNAIEGVMLNDHTLKIKRRFNISKPSDRFYASPYFALRYNRAENHYAAVFQQVSDESRDLVLVTLNPQGNYIRRTFNLKSVVPPLAGPMLMTAGAAAGEFTLFWSGLESDGTVSNNALNFSSLRPVARFQTSHTWKGKNLFFILPQTAVELREQVALYAFAQFPGRSSQKFVSRLLFNYGSGFGQFTRKVTNAREIEGSTELSSISDEDTFGELEPVTLAAARENTPFPRLEGGLFDPVTRQKILRTRLLPAGSFATESRLLPATEEQLTRLVWIERTGENYSIKVADLTATMELVPGSEVTMAAPTELMLSDLAAVTTSDGNRLILAWSEHQLDGTTRLLVRSLDQ